MRLRIALFTSAVLATCMIASGRSWADGPDAPGALASGPQVKEQNGMSYVSGGVGTEEGRALEQLSGRFNLKVTFATQHGKFLGGGPVRIEDAKGQALLDATSDGPTFFAKLPPGEYKVSAVANGTPLARTVQVSGDRQAQVAFVWPDGPGDRSTAGDAPEGY